MYFADWRRKVGDGGIKKFKKYWIDAYRYKEYPFLLLHFASTRGFRDIDSFVTWTSNKIGTCNCVSYCMVSAGQKVHVLRWLIHELLTSAVHRSEWSVSRPGPLPWTGGWVSYKTDLYFVTKRKGLKIKPPITQSTISRLMLQTMFRIWIVCLSYYDIIRYLLIFFIETMFSVFLITSAWLVLGSHMEGTICNTEVSGEYTEAVVDSRWWVAVSLVGRIWD
jgi:hypothetical protein